MSHAHNADGECRYCHKEFCIDCGYGGNNEDIEFCSQGCWENFQERAYQRHLEDYYGGDGPQTDRERQIKEYEGKYGVGGTHR